MIYPKEPHAGDKISAQLIRDIIRCLRAITPRPGVGCRMRFTPNGTFVDGGASSAFGGGSSSDKGCWKLVWEEDALLEKHLTMENRLYQIGGRIFEVSEKPYLESEFILQGELAEDQEYTADDRPYIALVVSMSPNEFGDAEVKGYDGWASMLEDANDESKYVKMLYKLSHDGNIVIDYRNMPQLAAAEM